jgi:hypothetical protein
MRNAFMLSVVALMMISVMSCKKNDEKSLNNTIKNSLNFKWAIKRVAFDTVEPLLTNGDTIAQPDGSYIEFIGGSVDTIGVWIERMITDTLKNLPNPNPTYRILSGNYRLSGRKQAARFLPASSDSLLIEFPKNNADSVHFSRQEYNLDTSTSPVRTIKIKYTLICKKLQ